MKDLRKQKTKNTDKYNHVPAHGETSLMDLIEHNRQTRSETAFERRNRINAEHAKYGDHPGVGF